MSNFSVALRLDTASFKENKMKDRDMKRGGQGGNSTIGVVCIV